MSRGGASDLPLSAGVGKRQTKTQQQQQTRWECCCYYYHNLSVDSAVVYWIITTLDQEGIFSSAFVQEETVLCNRKTLISNIFQIFSVSVF